jgi:hypothetical protein
MNGLAPYLSNHLPEGMAYPDAVQLCLRLYCTADGVPSELLPLTKEALADAFSTLARSGWVCVAGSEQVADPVHWLAVIRALLTKSPPSFDLKRAEVLARQVGFVAREVT